MSAAEVLQQELTRGGLAQKEPHRIQDFIKPFSQKKKKKILYEKK